MCVLWERGNVDGEGCEKAFPMGIHCAQHCVETTGQWKIRRDFSVRPIAKTFTTMRIEYSKVLSHLLFLRSSAHVERDLNE